MRALTVRQPWAWAIMHGGKDVENRSRNLAGSYRGPVAITAAVKVDDGAWLPDYALQDSQHVTYMSPRGVILGVVDFLGAHEWGPSGEGWDLRYPR